MRVVAGIFGVVLILLVPFDYFVAFLLPRRVRRGPRIARGLPRLLWLPWRALARRVSPATADTWLGFFGPFALLFQLVVWTLGLMTGYALLEWGAVGGTFGDRLLSSSGVFLSAESPSGSTAGHLIGLFEAASGVAVVFIVIGYLPAVYAAFSRRETAVSQLATRGGSPPAGGLLLHQAIGRQHWQELKGELQAWEEWAAELMETHLSYPLLGFYRSQHVSQNWLATFGAGGRRSWSQCGSQGSGPAARAAPPSGSRPAARSARVTASRTARKFARTATQTCCRGPAGPTYSTSSGRRPRTFAIGPSTARITSASEIWSGGSESQ